MHTIIITFELTDMTHERYTEVCAELAPAFAAVPGLRAKIWLADPELGEYGGVYLFADAVAADAFLGSTLARSVGTNPHFADLTVRRFSVDEQTTARTQPDLTIVSTSLV